VSADRPARQSLYFIGFLWNNVLVHYFISYVDSFVHRYPSHVIIAHILVSGMAEAV